MNSNMLANPATSRNLKVLKEDHGWRFVAPGSGELACGWTGPGRMVEPDEILSRAMAVFKRDLAGARILVTAGPTVEDIDPVRFISNHSTGKMGFAV